jgi:hypothetical protein
VCFPQLFEAKKNLFTLLFVLHNIIRSAPSALFGVFQRPTKRKPRKQSQRNTKMAKELKSGAPSRKELMEQYVRLKGRIKKAQNESKEMMEQVTQDLITVGTGAALGAFAGNKIRNGDVATEDEAYELMEGSNLDIDLVVGAVCAGAGMMKMGGKMSDTLRAVGIGGLTSYAARAARKAVAEME